MAKGTSIESAFRSRYQSLAAYRKAHGMLLNRDPDDPRHFYDHRKAFKAGELPVTGGHGSSRFKKLGHPNLIVGGMDTRTGKKAAPGLAKKNRAARTKVEADIARARAHP